jgi:hypothetical protein
MPGLTAFTGMNGTAKAVIIVCKVAPYQPRSAQGYTKDGLISEAHVSILEILVV